MKTHFAPHSFIFSLFPFFFFSFFIILSLSISWFFFLPFFSLLSFHHFTHKSYIKHLKYIIAHRVNIKRCTLSRFSFCPFWECHINMKNVGHFLQCVLVKAHLMTFLSEYSYIYVTADEQTTNCNSPQVCSSGVKHWYKIF